MVDFLFSVLSIGAIVELVILGVRECYKRLQKRREAQEKASQENDTKQQEKKEKSHVPRECGAFFLCLLVGSGVRSGLSPIQSCPSSSIGNSALPTTRGSSRDLPVCRLQSSSWNFSSYISPSISSSRRSLNTACCLSEKAIITSRSSLGCSSSRNAALSKTSRSVTNTPWKGSALVRGSGFKMTTLSKSVSATSAVGTTFADKSSFTEGIVGQKVNVSGSFFGRSLCVTASPRDSSRSRSSSRRSSRPGSAFASVAPSPAQTSVEQPQSEGATSTVVVDGRRIECFGVFCVTYDLKEDERPKTWKKTVRIAVSGAAGAISNHLLFKLASGEVFGPDQPIALNLLGSVRSRDALEGVAMELEDSLFPLLREVSIGIEPIEVFRDVDWALLIGAKPRGPGMERADLLDINGKIFAEQGRALNAVASPNVKVLVVGNPCNTNALIAMKNAPRVPAKNFHALTRLDENRAKCQLAIKAGVFYDNVSNVTIWGNHSTTQVPDFLNAKIHDKKVTDVISDYKWLTEEFTPTVQTRGGVLIKKWGRSSAASTAVSIADAIKSLVTPTPEGDWFSSGVYTNGNPYGIAEDLVFSMPCRSKGDGDYELVPEVLIDDWLRQRIKKSEDELLSEKKCVAHLIGEDGGFCNITEDTMLPGEV